MYLNDTTTTYKHCSNRKTSAKFPGSLVKCIFILTKHNETPLQVAERLRHHHVKTYLLKLERGETDDQSDGTGVDESVDGEYRFLLRNGPLEKRRERCGEVNSTPRVIVYIIFWFAWCACFFFFLACMYVFLPVQVV